VAPSDSAAPSDSVTSEPSPTAEPSDSASPSDTAAPQPSVTPTPTVSTSPSPSATRTPDPSHTPSVTSSSSTTASPSSSPTGHPSFTPTDGPSAGTVGAHGFAGTTVHVIGSGQTLTHVSEVAFDEFKDVLVDNKTLTADQYTVRSGSTVVTLKAAYLDTLAEGPHRLTVEFTKSEAIKDVFTVSKAGTGDSATPKPDPSTTYSTSAKPMPNTGANIGPGIALGLVAFGVGLMLTVVGGLSSRRPVARRAR
jgi:hypothetical protein